MFRDAALRFGILCLTRMVYTLYPSTDFFWTSFMVSPERYNLITLVYNILRIGPDSIATPRAFAAGGPPIVTPSAPGAK